MMTPEHTVRRCLVTTITATLLCGLPALAQRASVVPAGAVQPALPKVAARVQPAARRAARGRQVKIRTRSGDTLLLLADRFGVTAEEIAQLNGISVSASIDAGRELLIPLPSPEALMRASSERMSQHNNAVAMNAGGDAAIETNGGWENVQGVLMRRGSGQRPNEAARENVAESKQDVNEQRRTGDIQLSKIVEVGAAMRSTAAQPVWIYLVGGARVEADDVTENPEGVWYKRGGLSVFLERARIERIERERVSSVSETTGSWTERGWTTGNPKFDALIKENGARYGVDPYLIFCVMEQESHFNQYVVSPKGARGLMQLMPATAAHFGVRRAFDPAENIMGGTKYLKQLLENFNGRVDLVLAGYNAGEGAVARFGGNVPPYKETRNYVKRISKRYGQSRSFVPVAGGESTPSASTGLR
jgi:hypothetical protein